jgi:hypothetical protein
LLFFLLLVGCWSAWSTFFSKFQPRITDGRRGLIRALLGEAGLSYWVSSSVTILFIGEAGGLLERSFRIDLRGLDMSNYFLRIWHKLKVIWGTSVF